MLILHYGPNGLYLCTFGSFRLPVVGISIRISQRVLKWSRKTSAPCIVAVAYTHQVHFMMTFPKKKANLQAPAIGAFRAGQTNEVCRKELQGFDMLR